MDPLEKVQSCYDTPVRTASERAGLYVVEFWPKGREDEPGPDARVRQESLSAVAEVEGLGEGLTVKWIRPPAGSEISREDFEAVAIRLVLLHQLAGE